MTRPVKRGRSTTAITASATPPTSELQVLRSGYKALTSIITEGGEDIVGGADSDRFNSIINEVESLHQLVKSPREQILDAEALSSITSSLVTCVKAQSNGGITASDFIACLLKDFGRQCGPSSSSESVRDSVNWKNIGLTVSDIFRSCPGCCTMIGPMDTELKVRKAMVRKHVKPTESSQPEEVDGLAEERIDADKNMATMFNILRKHKSVKLENLVLNRNSFAQTVENLFALSFLVKDGRAEIKVNENGWHLVSPRNAAASSEVVSGDVAYRHFVFRFDFKDWKLMTSAVGIGEELMPNRGQINPSFDIQEVPAFIESQEAGPSTPIRKLSRNRGLVKQEEKDVEDSLADRENSQESTVVIIRKRKLTLT